MENAAVASDEAAGKTQRRKPLLGAFSSNDRGGAGGIGIEA
jgi:hypothetical protein